MLLNELQKQTQDNERQAESIGRLNAQLAATQRQVAGLRADLEGRLSALEQGMRAQSGNRKLAAAFNR
jgi:predicted  nucleic acid-binding Zn-ribbon protein